MRTSHVHGTTRRRATKVQREAWGGHTKLCQSEAAAHIESLTFVQHVEVLLGAK